MKYFVIGFNKTATSTLRELFKYNNLNTCHSPIWDFKNNDAFSDGWHNNKKFIDYDKKYPNSKFILNIRPLKKWLTSLIKQHKLKYNKKRWNKVKSFLLYPFNKELTKKYINLRNKHYYEVLEYFKYNPDKLIIIDISKKNWINFLCTKLNFKYKEFNMLISEKKKTDGEIDDFLQDVFNDLKYNNYEINNPFIYKFYENNNIINLLKLYKTNLILEIKNNNSSHGLNHNFSNLRAILNYSYNNYYIPIIPQFKFTAKHNNGKKLRNNFSKYFDFNNLYINKYKFNVILNNFKQNNYEVVDVSGCGLLRKHIILESHINEIFIENSKIILKEYNNIDFFKNKYMCIHVRRGDKLKRQNGHILNERTSIENIEDKILKYNVKNIYIMTNESDITYFKKLKDKFNIKFFYDFTNLNNIKKKDNYLLFQIEKYIMEKATIKIGTFNSDIIYDDFLCEIWVG